MLTHSYYGQNAKLWFSILFQFHYYSFTSYTFQQCKHFKNPLRFDKVTEDLKVRTFFETQCTRYTVVCTDIQNKMEIFPIKMTQILFTSVYDFSQ